MAICAICGETEDHVTKCKMCGEKFCAGCGNADSKLCFYCGEDPEDDDRDDDDDDTDDDGWEEDVSW